MSTAAALTERRLVVAYGGAHLAGWLGVLSWVIAAIGPGLLPRVWSVLVRGEQWLLLAFAIALVVVPVVSAVALWRWWRVGEGWPLLVATALSVIAAAGALGRWPHLVPWWALVLAITVEACGLLAAYLALARSARRPAR